MGGYIKLLVSQRIWSHLEGSQAYAEVRAGRTGATQFNDEAEISMMRKVYNAPVTRKDRRFWVLLTEAEAACLRLHVEVMREGAADNTWDEDGRADLFAATKFLEQMVNAGV